MSDDSSVAELSRTLGVQPDRAQDVGTVRPDSVTGTPARETSWELLERADSTGDVSEMVDRLMARVSPLKGALITLGEAGTLVRLSIVQHITAADAHGPGISLDASVVGFLAAVKGDIDIDQYVSFDADSRNE